jgi:hypothetical protein
VSRKHQCCRRRGCGVHATLSSRGAHIWGTVFPRGELYSPTHFLSVLNKFDCWGNILAIQEFKQHIAPQFPMSLTLVVPTPHSFFRFREHFGDLEHSLHHIVPRFRSFLALVAPMALPDPIPRRFLTPLPPRSPHTRIQGSNIGGGMHVLGMFIFLYS